MYRIGWIDFDITPEQAAQWNAAEADDAETWTIVLPTSQPDHSYVRNGEVILHPGLPSEFRGTVAEAIAEGQLPAGIIDDLSLECYSAERI